ncbi:MAG TPA: ATP-binding cassette domain-containing protein [Polyangiaceae bacterium]|nr:ATP-binding cassette domain-containing protein [Polyangiaceae bacterium]
MAAIRMRRVGRQFSERWILRDFDLEVPEGQTLALIGPSGSGKTTVLRLINRLLECSEGSIHVFGRDVADGDAAELRRRIGYVIQEIGTFPHYTVQQNVGVVPALLGWSRARIQARVHELLDLVGLPPAEFAGRYPHQLSGGQRQRVGFARALAADPPLVLFDEPFAALDLPTRESLQDEFRRLAQSLRKTFVVVTHDIFEAVRIAERIVVLHEGRCVRDAAPRDLVRSPGDAVVEALLGPHRYQLELMTTTLGEASAGPTSGSAARGSVIELPDHVSVWEALSRLSSSQAGAVRVNAASGARVLSREQLLRGAD